MIWVIEQWQWARVPFKGHDKWTSNHISHSKKNHGAKTPKRKKETFLQMPSWLGGFRVLAVSCFKRLRWKILIIIDDQKWLGFALGFGALASARYGKLKTYIVVHTDLFKHLSLCAQPKRTLLYSMLCCCLHGFSIVLHAWVSNLCRCV